MTTMAQAVRLALHVGEERLGVTDIFGEDVGPPLGGVFTCTQGLRTAWNSPLDERGIVGAAMGLALAGQRPVCEIQFSDYAYNTIDLLKLAGAMHWSSNGDWNCPMVLMTPVGAGIRGSLYHSHSFEATATHIPGWRVVLPSSPRDAYGLLLTALREPNPVMFLVPKALMRYRGEEGEDVPGAPEQKALDELINKPVTGDQSQWQPRWPDTPDLFIPFGQARTVRPGRDVTVVTYGRHVLVARKVAHELAREGIEAEVIDLRSLCPYDWSAVSASVRKTHRVVFLNEELEVTNFGEHLLRRTVDELFYELWAPPKLLAGAMVPGVGLADTLERASVPQEDDLARVVRELAAHRP
ncbi:MAG: transketolase C-terminal domain-containing protein [Polyangiales bacterium]